MEGFWHKHLRAAGDPHMPTYLPNLGSITQVFSQTISDQNSIRTQEHTTKVWGTLPRLPSSVPELLCKGICFYFVISVTSFCLSHPSHFHYFYCSMKTPAQRDETFLVEDKSRSYCFCQKGRGFQTTVGLRDSRET